MYVCMYVFMSVYAIMHVCMRVCMNIYAYLNEHIYACNTVQYICATSFNLLAALGTI